ncbi:MAG: hypothetical protein K2I96_25230 [Lachnospiraceae bacterium]|nr:hypothetical protein [Lachnospiraceae bacterium]
MDAGRRGAGFVAPLAELAVHITAAIPMEVRPGDEVEVPPNPYPFVMLPVLDYAEGEGIFPFFAEGS